MGKEKGGRLIPCDAKNYGKVIWGRSLLLWCILPCEMYVRCCLWTYVFRGVFVRGFECVGGGHR